MVGSCQLMNLTRVGTVTNRASLSIYLDNWALVHEAVGPSA